ncbi:SURF1 family protein [Pseudoroseicyclus sp. CXY001]|uniref:SURF1 family protein n=1 Tax=Pseudoroseicyclus sp. CXY001 TaxID=3242492 RepID=UPI003570AE62
MRRILVPLIFGIVGCAVLVSLGLWQLRRLEWKEAILAEIEARIAAEPLALEAALGAPDYTPVTLTGRIEGDPLRFIYSGSEEDLVVAVQTEEGRRIMVDLGLAPMGAAAALPEGPLTIAGNLDTPVGKGTPAPMVQNPWAARSPEGMAEVLGTGPVFVVAREVAPPLTFVAPLPVTTEGIANNHLGYAIQWFGIALVWAGMSVYLIRRTLRSKD